MDNGSRRQARRWAAVVAMAVGFGAVLSLAAIEAHAQQPEVPAVPHIAPPDEPKDGAPEAPQAAPVPPADGTAPGRPADRLPTTADEKSKLLADLYAHLAAADSAETAKKVQATIERLWGYSGSDTVALLMQRAAKALGAKNNDLALKFMDYVVLLAPDYAEGFNRRAFIHFSRNDMASAVGDLRRALALEPNHFKALDGLAQIWRQMGNSKGALSVVKQLLEVHPYWEGAAKMAEELAREVDGQGI
jgi:tetratricopeptide (TPR) repeat protein